MNAAWMDVGLAQRDLPTHVVNEYCHPYRSFHPLPAFNEKTLPRNLTIYNQEIRVPELRDGETHAQVAFFPLGFSDSWPGINFALIRGGSNGTKEQRHSDGGNEGCIGHRGGNSDWARMDLAAVSHLDEVRTADLTQSRENLLSIEPEHGPCMIS